ncbi:hypothetical protein BDV10DRAFT_157905 [Aspergillus recurvatus]
MPEFGLVSSDDSPDRPCLTLRRQNPGYSARYLLASSAPRGLTGPGQGARRVAAGTNPADTLVQINAVQKAYIGREVRQHDHDDILGLVLMFHAFREFDLARRCCAGLV